MEIVRDEPKRLANIARHGTDFADSMGKPNKSFKPGHGYSKKDWDDVQSPELPAEDIASPNKAPTEKLVTIRLSGSVIEKYKSGGEGWQSRIDADLKRLNKIK
jgi:uncharacterized protein (DUF4415 family)